MSEKKDFPQDKKKGLLKVILLFFTTLLLLLAVLVGVLQIPSVQTKVVKKLTSYLSKETGFAVEIDRIHLRWFDALSLDGLKVYDQQDSLMISVEETFADFSLMDLLNRNNPSLDEVVLSHPNVHLLKTGPGSGLNINAFIHNLRELLPARNKGPKAAVPFHIHKVVVHEGSFKYADHYKDTIHEYFDYHHIYLNQLNGELKDFRLISDTVEFDLQNLQAYDPRYDFSIHQLQTFYQFSAQRMLFDKLHVEAGNSLIQDSLVFAYKDVDALSYFTDSVNIQASLKGTVLKAQDLAVFAPYFKDFNDTYTLSGRFNGPVRNFDARALDIQLGGSSFKGELRMNGLPDFSETFIEAKLEQSHLHPEDLQAYLDETVYQNLKKLGNIDFSSQFLGFPNDFVANGQFNTDLGNINSDINLKLNPDNHQYSTYSGSLALHNFNLGHQLEDPDLGRISMKGTVSGSGFNLDKAKLQLKAEISKLHYRGYTYQNISTNGKLAKSFFEGRLKVHDPNLQIEGRGSVDLHPDRQHLKIKARLDTAFLDRLLLTDTETFVRSNIDLDITGFDLDELKGEAHLSNAYLVYENRDLSLDTLSLFSVIDSTNRQLKIETDKADLYASGNFDYTSLSRDLERLYHEYKLNFRNQSDEIEEYYNRKSAANQYDRYHIDYSLILKDINPVLHLFDPQLSISSNAEVEGSFTGGYTSILSANTQIDTLQYKNDFFYQLEAELNTSKIADSTNVLAMAYLHSQEQYFHGVTPTEGLLLEAIWDRDHIELSGDIRQKGSQNNADLNADVFFLLDRTELTFHNSSIQILENIWRLEKDNLIVYEDEEIKIENFIIQDSGQSLKAEGIISQDPEKALFLQVNYFHLANLNPILEQKLSGSISGRAEVRNAFKVPEINGQLLIDDFMIEKFLVGDLVLDAHWNSIQEYLDLEMTATRKNVEIVQAKGHYNPFLEENSLNIDATFHKTNLDLIEPFAEDMFSNIKGTASGQVRISGTPNYPVLRGGGNVNDGQIKINYLNTQYTFEGGIVFSENEIGFKALKLLDNEQNPATLNGGIFHDGFDNFIINLKAQLEGTKVLNTTFQENSLYYGTAYAIGDLEVLGPINNLQFISRARTAKGTKIFIPIDNSSDYKQQDFINFVNRKDTLSAAGPDKEKVNLSGIKLDFDLEITPDAYCEIIFDLRAGDIIRGRGNGKIALNIDTEGEFNMFGNYEITQGAYNFTMFNVITKEFIIDPGSNIRWLGDPYGAILDIQARYNQSASLLPILQPDPDPNQSASPQKRRPYPVTVEMDLKGELLSPSISFDIDIRDYPGQFYNDVQSFKTRLQTDEQYLNRQVFNLIVLRQFVPDQNQNALDFGSRTAISSISELLSTQLSAMITQIDDNLEIDLDVSSSNRNSALDPSAANSTFNTYQLRMSYTFLDGRLRISRDGSISSRPDQQDVSNLVGDWTVEYMLTPDGQYRVKMYSRNNLNQFNNTFDLESYTRGISFSQTKSFDSLEELFENRKKKQRKLPKPIQDNNDEGLLRDLEEELLIQ